MAGRGKKGGQRIRPEYAYRSLNQDDIEQLWMGKPIYARGELTGLAGWNAALNDKPSAYIPVTEAHPSQLKKGDPENYIKFQTAFPGLRYISHHELLQKWADLDIKAADHYVEQELHALVKDEIPYLAIVEFYFMGEKQDLIPARE